MVCSSYFYYIRDLCRHLDLDSVKVLAHALVSSRLDYGNSHLFGIANIDLTKVQHVQNLLACVATKSPLFICNAPFLHSLHWLPNKFRTAFKTCLLTYINNLFICSPLPATSLPSHSLRSYKGLTVFSFQGSVRPTPVQGHFGLEPQLCGTTSH